MDTKVDHLTYLKCAQLIFQLNVVEHGQVSLFCVPVWHFQLCANSASGYELFKSFPRPRGRWKFFGGHIIFIVAPVYNVIDNTTPKRLIISRVRCWTWCNYLVPPTEWRGNKFCLHQHSPTWRFFIAPAPRPPPPAARGSLIEHYSRRRRWRWWCWY